MQAEQKEVASELAKAGDAVAPRGPAETSILTRLTQLEAQLEACLERSDYAGAARLEDERQTCEEEMLKAASAGPRQAMTRQATAARSASLPPGWKHGGDVLDKRRPVYNIAALDKRSPVCNIALDKRRPQLQ